MRRELDGRRMHETNLARFARSIMSPARISGDRAGIEDVMTMRPLRLAFIAGRHALIARNVPLRLVLSTSSHANAGIFPAAKLDELTTEA
jgi:hypothetical protein